MDNNIVYNKILIVTGGNVDYKLLDTAYKSQDYQYIIGVDKGLEALVRLDIKPDIAIGDFDSANESIRAIFVDSPGAIILNSEKDYTDTHVAVLHALRYKPEQILVLGATGTRLDHVQGNYALLKLARMGGVEMIIADSNNRIRMIDRQLSIIKKNSFGRYISLIPYSDKVTGITLKGFKYELNNATMIKEETVGISNELREEEGHITIDSGYLLVMETED
ncbi:MAG: thiamine diphosphokinase [Wujia sp.]